jgi:hypothetical protein
MSIRRHHLFKLDAYRCAHSLYALIKRIAGQFPRGEADLRSQMRRASRSVKLNIGEGRASAGEPVLQLTGSPSVRRRS